METLAVAAGATLVIYLCLEFWILRRLQYIHHEVAKVGPDNLLPRLDEHGSDEFGQLAHALNLMFERLMQSESRDQLILDSINDGFFELDLHGRVTTLNRALEQMLGYSRAEMLGRSYKEALAEEDIVIFEDAVGKFFDEHAPESRVARWREDGIVERAMWTEAAEAGLACLSIPEEYGGMGGDYRHEAVLMEQLGKHGIDGFGITLHNAIIAPYITAYGTEEPKRRWLPKMVSGEHFGAIGMTEPGGGSDLKALRTRASEAWSFGPSRNDGLVNRGFIDRSAETGFEEVEIAAFVGLGHMLLVQADVAPLVRACRWRPGGTAALELRVNRCTIIADQRAGIDSAAESQAGAVPGGRCFAKKVSSWVRYSTGYLA